MGLLIDGRWHDQWYENGKDGAFKRENAQRRNRLPAPEAGRYHLYVSLACPWAHRTLIFRALKGLEPLIDVSVVSWLMQDHGWTFDQQQGSSGDHLDGLTYLHQRYTQDDPHYTGRVTVPVLWDKQEKRIVNNESSEIIRIFNSAFNELTGNHLDLYPEPLRPTIEALNERIYQRSTTVFTAQASPPRKRPMRRRSMRCSASWIIWRSCSAATVTWLAST